MKLIPSGSLLAAAAWLAAAAGEGMKGLMK
jgi:hypothetical protein